MDAGRVSFFRSRKEKLGKPKGRKGGGLEDNRWNNEGYEKGRD